MRFIYLLGLVFLSSSLFAQKYYLFVGTYTEGNGAANGSKGIYVYKFDASSGDITPVSSVFTDNPSYLALAPDGKFLYSVNETHGDKPGSVSSFSFDKKTG